MNQSLNSSPSRPARPYQDKSGGGLPGHFKARWGRKKVAPGASPGIMGPFNVFLSPARGGR